MNQWQVRDTHSRQIIKYSATCRSSPQADSVLIYTSFARVPIARGGDVARRGQLRKPEQQVGAEVKCSVETSSSVRNGAQ